LNYLVLTNDGIGSSYLQRSLTLYLNSAGIEYWNTHELLNGVACNNGNIYKQWRDNNFELQPVNEIITCLNESTNNIVSRVGLHWAHERNDISTLYPILRSKYNKILMCKRDPFEYALSWAIRSSEGIGNLYRVDKKRSLSLNYDVDMDFFKTKLEEYHKYIYWTMDNFNAQEVNYNDLQINIDNMMQKITGLDHSVEDKFGISLQNYSRVRYLASTGVYEKEHTQSAVALKNFENRLKVNKQLPKGMPIKLYTLDDKRKRIDNFTECVNVFNNWAAGKNEYDTITSTILEERIYNENKIYARTSHT
jgi:hypothetical protein